MMFQFVSKKVTALFLAVLLILTPLSGCSQSTSTAVQTGTQAQSTAVATPQSSAEPVSRLSDILDGKKYANLFTIRVFNIAQPDATTKNKLNAGDIILLQSPDGKNMLIDTGHKETVGDVIQNMKKIGVTKLDYLVATHMHGDHVGGFPAIMDAFPVDIVMSSRYATRNITQAKTFMSTLAAKGKELTVIKEGDSFQFGKDIKVEVLSPVGDIEIPYDDYSNQNIVNEQSVVLKITYGSKTFLMCGDIQKDTENRLIEKYGDKINVDLIKVPHHGYSTSSSNVFIQALSPDIALVSQCQMPHMDVLERYQKNKSKVYISGLDGIVLATSDGKNINIITEKDRKGNLKP